METYKNSGGESGISSYKISTDYIEVKFSTGKTYSYSYRKAGKRHVDQKILAQRGNGLNGYINKNVKDLFD